MPIIYLTLKQNDQLKLSFTGSLFSLINVIDRWISYYKKQTIEIEITQIGQSNTTWAILFNTNLNIVYFLDNENISSQTVCNIAEIVSLFQSKVCLNSMILTTDQLDKFVLTPCINPLTYQHLLALKDERAHEIFLLLIITRSVNYLSPIIITDLLNIFVLSVNPVIKNYVFRAIQQNKSDTLNILKDFIKHQQNTLLQLVNFLQIIQLDYDLSRIERIL